MVPMEERSPLGYKTGGTERCGAVHITARETCQGRAGSTSSGQGLRGFPWAINAQASKVRMGDRPGTWYLDPGQIYLGNSKSWLEWKKNRTDRAAAI